MFFSLKKQRTDFQFLSYFGASYKSEGEYSILLCSFVFIESREQSLYERSLLPDVKTITLASKSI